jgi:hypothetical protein
MLTEDGGIGPPVTMPEAADVANALNVEEDMYVRTELTLAVARIDPLTL